MGSGQQWGTAIGFVAGFFLPGGPQVWAGIGGLVGGAIDPTVMPGPRIGEINKQTASEGIPRPIIFARSQPMPGNVIADSEPRKVYREESAKGGPKVETESIYRTYAIGLCEGPNVVLLEAWKNGQSVYNIEDPSRSADNAEFLEYARWFDGSYEQMPSPDLEEVLGVGNVHAHRGLAYIVFADEDVTDNRGSWSQWTFRLGRYANVQDGRWWALGGLSNTQVWRSTGNIAFDDPGEVRGPPRITYFPSNYGDGVVKFPDNTMVIHGSTGQIEKYTGYTAEMLPIPVIETIYEDSISLYRIRSFDNCAIAIVNAKRYHVWTESGGWQQVNLGPDETIGDINRLPNKRWVTVLIKTGDNQRYACYSDDDVPLTWVKTPIVGNPGYTLSAILVSGGYAVTVGFYSEGRFAMRTLDGIVWTPSEEFWNNGLNGHVSPDGTMVFVDPNSTIICRSTNEGATFQAIETGQTWETASYGNGTWVISGDNGSDQQNIQFSHDDALTFTPYLMPEPTAWKVAFADPPFSYRAGYYPLPLIIEELSQRVNAVAHIDVSMLAGYQCRGFTVTNSYPCYSALQELSKVFFFNPANVNGTVKFVPLGADSVATITEDDMIDNEDEIESDSRRGDAVLVPRVLHLNYFDVFGGMNTDKQRSERPEGTRAVGEQSMQTPVILSADEAATIVYKNHAMLVEQQKGELTFALPDNWLRLTESDPVIVQYEGKSLRAVIQQVETDDGEQRYRAIRDRQSIHTLQVEGIPPAPVTPPPSRLKGPTLIEVIDGPLWRDADDRLGIFVAVTGIYPSWPGAFVELSLDGGATYIDGASTNVSAIMGSVTAGMGDHHYAYPDTVNSVQVIINTPDVTLEGTDLIGMLNLRNLALIGEEYIHFADVDEVSPGVWDLSYFLRGRKGTQTVGHAIGERFVMLNNAVFFVPLELVYLNQSLTFRATTFGTPVEDATIETLTFAGGTQREFKVSSLTARRDGTDAVISWYGAGRIGDGFNVAHGVAFAGYRVTITDGSVTQTFDQATTSLTTSLSAFTGPVTIKVYQRNSMTGLGPSTEVTI